MKPASAKKCSKCGEIKEEKDFVKHSSYKSGYTPDCKICYGKRSKKTKADYTQKIQNRSRSTRYSFISRHKRLGIDLSTIPSAKELNDWIALQIPLICHYTKQPVKITDFHIDHKQPLSRGGNSEISNLCITSSSMNLAKGSLNEEEFKSLLTFCSQMGSSGDYILARLRRGFMVKGNFKK